MTESSPVGVNGQRAWEAFWRILSLLVIPWATFITWGLWQMSTDVRNIQTTIELERLEYTRRLEIIEQQMAPTNRFYRWDGDNLRSRIEELERLHPRKLEERRP